MLCNPHIRKGGVRSSPVVAIADKKMKKIRHPKCEKSERLKMKTSVLMFIAMTLVAFLLHSATIAKEKGLTLHFDFAQKGDKVEDVSGTGNDGIIEGNPEWLVDPSLHSSKAMKFSTAADGVKVSNTTRSLNPQEDKFTIALWFKYTQVFPTDVALVYTFWGSYRHEIKDGKLHFGIWEQGGPVPNRGAAEGVYQWTGHKKDTWYHLAFVYDGNELREYINGEEVRKIDDKGHVADRMPVRIGDFVKIGYPDVEVYLGDVRYYNDQALSEAEVAKLVEAGLAVRPHGKLPVSWGELKNSF